MSTVVNFNGKNIVEPGVYAQTKANVNINPVPFSTGNVLIIDDGSGVDFGGGSGINGDLASGLNSVYNFTSLIDFRNFVRGGKLWDLAEYLFIPENGVAGAPQVSLIRAATTTPSTITYDFTAGANGGTLVIDMKNEGLEGKTADDDESISSSVAADTKVRTGWGSLMKSGVIDNTKYFIEFYEGTFKGLDADGDPYDGLDILSCEPIIIAKSPEFNNLNDLITWINTDTSFNARFKKNASTTVVGTGALVAGDYTANNTLKLATGGTTVYGSTDFDEVLAKIGEVDYTFVLSLNSGILAKGANNTKLLYHITQQAEFKKFMFVGGGDDENAWTGTNGSIDIAQYFNSAYAITCHSGHREDVNFTAEEKLKSSLYHAACVCGRLAGLAPQTSGTFKSLRIKKWRHVLTPEQRVTALQAGVLHNRYVQNIGYVINQAINTIQKNTQMINPDATSNEISIMRIAEQLNKELVLNMRPIFVGQNLNTASPADVKAFIEGYLTQRTATKINDNYIIRFSNVSVVQVQDYYNCTYNFVANSPLNKIFITGFMLDANLSA
jgi:hypothetical protein